MALMEFDCPGQKGRPGRQSGIRHAGISYAFCKCWIVYRTFRQVGAESTSGMPAALYDYKIGVLRDQSTSRSWPSTPNLKMVFHDLAWFHSLHVQLSGYEKPFPGLHLDELLSLARSSPGIPSSASTLPAGRREPEVREMTFTPHSYLQLTRPEWIENLAMILCLSDSIVSHPAPFASSSSSPVPPSPGVCPMMRRHNLPLAAPHWLQDLLPLP